jgi:hypothetical protein
MKAKRFDLVCLLSEQKQNNLICSLNCLSSFTISEGFYTDKKEKKIFLIYKEIQMGAGAKS